MKRFLRRTDVRPNPGRDVNDELRFHIDMRAQEFIDAGLSPDDARRAATHAFGDLSAIDSELRAARATRGRTINRRDRLSEIADDIAFAIRTLRKHRAFTAAAIATLALGIGATIAVFTVVNGVLLRPLPYADPQRLAMIWLSSKSDGVAHDLPLSGGFFSDIESTTASFSSTAAFRAWGYTLTSDGAAETVAGARVTPSLFPVLGVRPLLGRSFVDADAQPGAARVVVLSYDLWQRRFGGTQSIVGKHIGLGGEPVTVVGVMPRAFGFPRGAELPSGLQFGSRTELWAPLVFSAHDRQDHRTLNLAAIGRLKPRVEINSAQSELSARLKIFLAANAPTSKIQYHLADLRHQAGDGVRSGLLLLMGAVAFVLFIACANVTNLLVARTAARQREFAVRAALGAGRSRIARQLITENVVLAFTGTALGIGLAFWAMKAMLALVPGSMPRVDDVTLDWRIAGAAMAIVVVIGAVFGIVSMAQVRWAALAGTLHESGTRSTGGRARSVGRRSLVVAEVSLSLILVIGATLFAVSFMNLQRTQPGFSVDGKLTAAVTLPLTGSFDPARDGPAWSRFFSQATTQLAKSPGIDAVGGVSSLPLSGAVEWAAIHVDGQTPPATDHTPQAQYSVIEGDYFRAIGIPVIAGRAFDTRDAANGPPVIIVNREFARRHLHAANALDARVVCTCDFSNGVARTVVGVVDDVHQTALDAPPEPQVYLPEAQVPYPGLHFVIRTTGDPMASLPVLKREVSAIDPRLAVADVRTLSDVVAESLARQRFSMVVVAVFAVAALMLALVGLYGVIALSVGQRSREIGVRMALGARPRDVLRLILGEGLRISAAGTLIGLGGALAMSRVVRALLFNVSATNAGVYAIATSAIAIITLVATYIPARRATRLDPTLALRSD